MSSLFKPDKLGPPLDESTSKFKKSPSIILVTIFAQMYTLSDINIETPIFFNARMMDHFLLFLHLTYLCLYV